MKRIVTLGEVKKANNKNSSGPEHNANENSVKPHGILYADKSRKEVPKEKAVLVGLLYYLDDNNNFADSNTATNWALTWYDIKTGAHMGEKWVQIIRSNQKK